MPESIRSPIPPKPVLLFAIHALVLALLIGYWPSPRAVYPGLFRAQARLRNLRHNHKIGHKTTI